MSGARVQGLFALAIAVAIHASVFILRPQNAGAVSAGIGGEDLVSLEAADAVLADLIEEWDRPPEVENVAQPDVVPPEAPPDLPQVAAIRDLSPTQPVMPALNLPAQEEQPLAADITLPAPPPPEPEPEPVPEPEKLKLKPKPKPEKKAETPKPEKKPKPQKKAQQKPSEGRAAQKAAGSGGGAVAGDAGVARAATLAPGKAASLKASWGAAVRSRIERKKRYPKAAAGARGRVTLRLVVTRTGGLAAVSVANSSGNAALDQAAIAAVRNAGNSLPAAPKGLTDASYAFSLRMAFDR